MALLRRTVVALERIATALERIDVAIRRLDAAVQHNGLANSVGYAYNDKSRVEVGS